jgi:glycosyltransferase involved in cell wall biosynthesis
MNNSIESGRLTIAIPTWNRPEHLRETVAAIIPQLQQGCDLLIVDNASTEPAGPIVSQFAGHLIGKKIHVVRNVVNIGGEPNILRCIELCNAEWVWLLGDDDVPCTNAVQTILEHIQKHNESSFINFSDGGLRKAIIKAKSGDEFIRIVDYFGTIQWMSLCVFRTMPAREAIRFAFFHQCMSVTFVLAYFAIGKEGTFVLSPDLIIAKSYPAVWSKVRLLANLGLVLSLPLTPEQRCSLARKLVDLTHIRHPRNLYRLLCEEFGDDDVPTLLYYYDQICGRLCWAKRGLKVRVEQMFVRWMLCAPRLARIAVRVYKRWVGRPLPVFPSIPLDERL